MKILSLVIGLLSCSLAGFAQTLPFQLKRFTPIEHPQLALSELRVKPPVGLSQARGTELGVIKLAPSTPIEIEKGNLKPAGETKSQPKFHSNMPIIRPDSTTHFHLLVKRPDSTNHYHLRIKPLH